MMIGSETLAHTEFNYFDERKVLMGNNDDWFYYPSYENYSPNGMPDFDQRADNNWKDPMTNGYAFCGPTSVSNILWYIDSMYSDSNGTPGDGKDNFLMVKDFKAPSDPNPGPFSDDHNFNNVNDLDSIWDLDKDLFPSFF